MGGPDALAAWPAGGERTRKRKRKSRASNRTAIFHCIRVDEELGSHRPSANAGPLQAGVGASTGAGVTGVIRTGAAPAASGLLSASPPRALSLSCGAFAAAASMVRIG